MRGLLKAGGVLDDAVERILESDSVQDVVGRLQDRI